MTAAPSALIQAFRQYFEIVPADTEALRDEVFRIRYEVYCRELGYEPTEAYPTGRETDEYDARSLHCLLRHRPSGRFAGCVRLVLNEREAVSNGLPFEHACEGHLRRSVIDPDKLPRERFGEISRLAVISAFRRRAGEQEVPHGVVDDLETPVEDRRRVFPHIALGLYLAAGALALHEGIDIVFAMMEPRLARHMRRYGIVYTQAGDVIDYRGQRGPFFITRDQLYSGLQPEIRQLLELIRSDLGQRLERSPTDEGES